MTPELNLSVAGRYNYAQINLSDQFGGPVNGQNTFAHFNPSVGLTYQVKPWLQVYGNFSVTNRAPTPQELSCSSAANPCSLLNFFVGDPPLKQVVAHTFEFGARGVFGNSGDGRWSWNADIYHTLNYDDLVYETTTYNPNLAYYVNAGKTLRQGFELSLHYDAPTLHAILGYAYTDATFQSPLLLGSPENPMADANGNIQVMPGNHIPGIPLNRITGQVDYNVTDKWVVGGSASYQSSFWRYGDEANLTSPLSGYWIANLHTSYKVTDKITVLPSSITSSMPAITHMERLVRFRRCPGQTCRAASQIRLRPYQEGRSRPTQGHDHILRLGGWRRRRGRSASFCVRLDWSVPKRPDRARSNAAGRRHGAFPDLVIFRRFIPLFPRKIPLFRRVGNFEARRWNQASFWSGSGAKRLQMIAFPVFFPVARETVSSPCPGPAAPEAEPHRYRGI